MQEIMIYCVGEGRKTVFWTSYGLLWFSFKPLEIFKFSDQRPFGKVMENPGGVDSVSSKINIFTYWQKKGDRVLVGLFVCLFWGWDIAM